jgi:hypothetical protein
MPAQIKAHAPEPLAHTLGANVLRVGELGQNLRLQFYFYVEACWAFFLEELFIFSYFFRY